MSFPKAIIRQTTFSLAIILGMFFLSAGACEKADEEEKTETFGPDALFIPTAGNTWVPHNTFKTTDIISEQGTDNWKNPDDTLRTYFHTNATGQFRIGLRARKVRDPISIKVVVNNQEKEITLSNDDFQNIPAGTFEIEEKGYQAVDIYALSEGQKQLPFISDIIIAGDFNPEQINYARDDFYWGRRGPSVHLRYEIPESAGNIRYFYNEITVPEGEDAIGSYFMANGFGQGYFGIQVNSREERRILFSVWSPYETDNPEEIPEDMRIELLRKGDGVTTGEFGNEGSGGQSYKKFMWETETTYGFLLKGEPTGNNSTVFTAWFFDPQTDQWSLIASFKRPETDTWLTNLHSFLENFYPETGIISRKAHYSNQWIRTTHQEWHELTDATFTADATARKKARLDYAGGSENTSFFLKNCGFFNNTTVIDSQFSREAHSNQPTIHFNELP